MLTWSSHVYYFYLMTYSIGKIPICEAKGQNSVNVFAALGTTRWMTIIHQHLYLILAYISWSSDHINQHATKSITHKYSSYTNDTPYICDTSSEFVSSSIPSWQILTVHAQPFRGARDLAFCLKVPLDSLLVWASSGGSGETAQMRRLAWTFAAHIVDKYQIRLTRPISSCITGWWSSASIFDLDLYFMVQWSY